MPSDIIVRLRSHSATVELPVTLDGAGPDAGPAFEQVRAGAGAHLLLTGAPDYAVTLRAPVAPESLDLLEKTRGRSLLPDRLPWSPGGAPAPERGRARRRARRRALRRARFSPPASPAPRACGSCPTARSAPRPPARPPGWTPSRPWSVPRAGSLRGGPARSSGSFPRAPSTPMSPCAASGSAPPRRRRSSASSAARSRPLGSAAPPRKIRGRRGRAAIGGPDCPLAPALDGDEGPRFPRGGRRRGGRNLRAHRSGAWGPDGPGLARSHAILLLQLRGPALGRPTRRGPPRSSRA